jgi:hypothetical protein
MSAKMNLDWKITAILCTLILSGTALFIYEDSKADRLRQWQQAQAEKQKQLPDFATLKPITNAASIGYDILEPETAHVAPVLSPSPTLKFVTPKPADPVLEEMRRANQIASDKLFFEELNTPDSLDRYMDRKQQSDLIWLQSLQADDLHRIRQIYEQQDFRQQYGGQ